MRSLGASGVWELLVPDAEPGQRYKFRILGRDGVWREKSDPLAAYSEVPGRTASVVFASEHVWGDQEWVAQHFARSVPPIALCNGIDVRDDDPRLLKDAAGWLVARTVDQVVTGDHTFFVGEVASLEVGRAPSSLTYVHHGYKQV